MPNTNKPGGPRAASRVLPFVPPLVQPFALLFACLCALPGAALAETSMGVSKNPDSKVRFVWPGEDKMAAKDPNTQMLIKVQNGGAAYGINVSADGVDITFDKSELAQIKWCAYLATEAERDQNKTCKPDKPLKPGGVIRLP